MLFRSERQKIKLLQDGEADETDIMLARAKYRGTSQEYTRKLSTFYMIVIENLRERM